MEVVCVIHLLSCHSGWRVQVEGRKTHAGKGTNNKRPQPQLIRYVPPAFLARHLSDKNNTTPQRKHSCAEKEGTVMHLQYICLPEDLVLILSTCRLASSTCRLVLLYL